MESWTQEQNILLCCLLDDVTGTEEMLRMRQECCKIYDCCFTCNPTETNRYYTGSKAEGLDLPGSDNDCMFDINNIHEAKKNNMFVSCNGLKK